MINNFKQISELMSFNNDDEFYFVQLLQRKKEHPELGSNNRLVKTYYIKSVEQLLKLEDEMIFFADYFNARIGINLNKRSYKKTAFHTLKKITDQILNEDYKSTRRAYNTMCGKYTTGDKLWLIDVDDKTLDPNEIIEMARVKAPVGMDKFVAKIPTKNGYHLIMKPFNLEGLKYTMLGVDDIHKNNPTILYIK